MTDCDEIQLLLGAVQDGEAEPHEMALVDAHLDRCPACPAALRSYEALGVALRELPGFPIPRQFAQNVTKRLTRLQGGGRWRLAQLGRSLGAFGSALEIAGVAAVAAIVTVLVATPYLHSSGLRMHPVQGAAQSPISSTAQAVAIQPVGLAKGAGQADEFRQAEVQNVAGKIEDADAAATLDTQEMVSALGGGSGPSVAVWNEPRTDTTVVWIPDQR